MKKIFLILCVGSTVHLFAGLSDLRKTVKDLDTTIADLRLKISDLEQENARLSKGGAVVLTGPAVTQPDTANVERIAKLEKELDTLKSINKDLLSKLPKPGQEDPLAKKITELTTEIDKLKKQLTKEAEKHNRATQMIAQLKKEHSAELKHKDTEIDTLREIASTKTGAQKTASLEAEVTELKEKIARQQRMLDEKFINESLGAAKISEIKNIAADLDKKSAEIATLKTQLSEQTADAKECKIKLLKSATSSQESLALSKKVASLEAEIESLQATLKERQNAINELETKLGQALKQLGQAQKQQSYQKN